jgi:hypothetical protein
MSEHISVHIIDVAEIIGSQRVGRLQMLVIALCAAVFADGFDVQVMGYIAPSLARDWHQEYLTILVVACVAAEWTPLRSEGTGDVIAAGAAFALGRLARTRG